MVASDSDCGWVNCEACRGSGKRSRVKASALDHRTTAQRWADKVTEFSGSWAFIGWFAVICVGWIIANATEVARFDPFPFLFLNWLLTVVSTFQNPLILLSQNRQNETDREHMQELLSSIAELKEEVKNLRG